MSLTVVLMCEVQVILLVKWQADLKIKIVFIISDFTFVNIISTKGIKFQFRFNNTI